MAALRAQRVWQLATIQPAVNSINCRRQLASLPPLLRHCFTKLEDTSKFGVVDQGGTRAVSYESLHQQSISVAHELLGTVGSQQRVGFLLTPDSTWLATLFGVWLSGNTAVPLCTKHSLSELEYVLTDAEAAVVITDQLHQELATDACKQAQVQSLLRTETILSTASQIDPYQALPSLPTVSADDDGLVIYTSGTTSKPKGVLTTHGTIHHQIQALHTAWRWTPSDVIINVLPLHHVHGVLNVVLSSAAIGATVEMCSGFDPSYTFDRLAGRTYPSADPRPLSVFMAVPTVYSKLLKEYDARSKDDQKRFSKGSAELRLMVSGSAALPQTIFDRWSSLTSHRLLERYGMTEIGMALGNPYEMAQRRPGYVGLPFVGVEVKMVMDDGSELFDTRSCLDNGRLWMELNGQPLQRDAKAQYEGALLIKGPNVFKEYINKPEATRAEFDDQGYFKTGDVVRYDGCADSYAILGRASADIIKSGGYKLSALEIERYVLEHPNVAEVAIVGVEDEEWGQRVAAVVLLKQAEEGLTLDALRQFLSGMMSGYKLPTILKVLDTIPKNAMGKVNKKSLVNELF